MLDLVATRKLSGKSKATQTVFKPEGSVTSLNTLNPDPIVVLRGVLASFFFSFF